MEEFGWTDNDGDQGLGSVWSSEIEVFGAAALVSSSIVFRPLHDRWAGWPCMLISEEELEDMGWTCNDGDQGLGSVWSSEIEVFGAGSS